MSYTKAKVSKKFAYEHLATKELKATSKHFHDLAMTINDTVPECAEKSQALASLWEAKNNAVWAVVNER